METLITSKRVIEIANITALLANKVNDIIFSNIFPQCATCEVPIYNGSHDPEVFSNYNINLKTRFEYNPVHKYEKFHSPS